MPPLSKAAETALDEMLPSFGTAHNPLDITGGAVTEPVLFERALRIMTEQPEFAALVCLFDVPTTEEQATGFYIDALRSIGVGLKNPKIPSLLISHTFKPVTETGMRIIAELDLPYVSAGIAHGISALGHAWRWSEQQLRTRQPWLPAAAAGVVTAQPRTERAVLGHLAEHGVPVVPATVATDAATAVAAARAIGGAVVLKIASADILHKSDIGGVALNLEGDAAIEAAFHRITAAAPQGAKVDGVLVSPMRERGLELFVGCTRDAQWGPVIAVGLGGIFVEILQDVALRVLPVAPEEVRRMLGELKGTKLLHGQRGVPPADLDALANAVARIGDAALALGADLEALDVNPLWVRGAHVEALDALAVWRN